MRIRTAARLLTVLLLVASAWLFYSMAAREGGEFPDQAVRDAAFEAMNVTSIRGPSEAPIVTRPGDPVGAEAVLAGVAPEPIALGRFRVSAPAKAPRSVQFELSDLNQRQLSPRARLEQLRDWLLFAAVSEHVETASGLRQVFFDFPVVRYGHMEAMATFEFGPTRARYIGDGQTVGLIPEGLGAAERRDALAGISDGLRKDVGEAFDELLVYEYVLLSDDTAAQLSYTETIPGHRLFGSTYGYVEDTIRSSGDLQAFLGRIDYIVLARPDGKDGGLRLGGRKLRPGAYRGIAYEHVAALYQSELGVRRAQQDFERWSERRLREYNNCLRTRLAGQLDRSRLQRQYDAEVTAEMLERRLVDGSGFSLDPTFDLDGLSRDLVALCDLNLVSSNDEEATTFAALQQVCPDPKAVFNFIVAFAFSESTPRDWTDTLLSIAAELTAPSEAAEQRTGSLCSGFAGLPDIQDQLRLSPELLEILSGVSGSKQNAPRSSRTERVAPKLSTREVEERVSAVYRVLSDLDKAQDARGALLHCVVKNNSFQSARYDGPLQGTEVGMVLFYTDLLAKIWAIRYADADPSDTIEGFVNLFNQPLEAVYEAESRALPAARLWFGHNNRGFGLGLGKDEGALLMGRTVTRIYAAGSNPVNPGEEVQTSRLMGAPMKWWNDYYEEVARYEREYQRLNEIMKWSLVLGWLNEREDTSELAFLENADVRRDLWFPDWARQQKDLKFAAWETVSFFELGYLGTTTETMPILATYSPTTFDPEVFRAFEGGVSLAPRKIFTGRVKPRADVAPTARRSFLDYANSKSQRRLASLDNATYSFADDGLRVRTTTVEGTRRQGIGGELANHEVSRRFAASAARQEIELSAKGAEIGVLVKEGRGNALSIGFRSRTIDRVMDIARRASRAGDDLSNRLAASPDVGRVLEASSGAGVRRFVQVRRSGEWIEVGIDPPDSITVSAGWSGRASETGAAQGLLFRYADKVTFDRILADTKTLVFRRGDAGGVIARTADEPIAATGKQLSLRAEENLVPARLLDDGSLAVSVAELPAGSRLGPDRLSRLMSEESLLAARAGDDVVALRHVEVGDGASALQRAVARGERKHIVLKAAENPNAVRTALTEQYERGLESVRRYLSQARPGDALAQVHELTRVFGETPELTLLNGLSKLDTGRWQQAVSTLNRIPGGRLRHPSRFADEVAYRLGSARPPEPPFGGGGRGGESGGRAGGAGSIDDSAWRPGADGAYAYERAFKLADFRRRHPPGESLKLAMFEREPHLEYRLADDALQKAEAVPSSELQGILRPDGRVTHDVFVPVDGPLGRLDWSQGALPDTLAQVVQSGQGRVVRLPVGDAAVYRPSRLYDVSTQRAYHRATTSKFAGATLDSPGLQHAMSIDLVGRSARAAARGVDVGCSEDDPENCVTPDDVYMVIEN